MLKCLLAQRSEYAKAKDIALRKGILITGLCIFSIIAEVVGTNEYSAMSCLFALIVVIINQYADGHITFLKKQAALIQQFVDVNLFAETLGMDTLEWGNVSVKPALEYLIYSYSDADTSEMKNWYSDYSSQSGEEEVFYCQYENVRWDFKLYESFKRFLLFLSLATSIILCVVIYATQPNFIKLVCLFAPLIPICEYLYSNVNEINHTISLLQRLEWYCAYIQFSWKYTNIRGLRRNLIKLQYMIYDRRAEAYLIPDWFYKLNRPKQQKDEDNYAQNRVNLNC